MTEPIQQDDGDISEKHVFHDVGARLVTKDGAVYELVRNKGWVLVDGNIHVQHGE